MNKLHKGFMESIEADLENETAEITNAQYQQCLVFNKEVMADATRIKEDLDMLRDKILSNYDVSPDKSFIKGNIELYEKCLPQIDIDGL